MEMIKNTYKLNERIASYKSRSSNQVSEFFLS